MVEPCLAVVQDQSRNPRLSSTIWRSSRFPSQIRLWLFLDRGPTLLPLTTSLVYPTKDRTGMQKPPKNQVFSGFTHSLRPSGLLSGSIWS